MLKTWDITSGEDYVSQDRLKQLETILFEKVRQKTFSKQDEGKTLQKALQYVDFEKTGVIDRNKFKLALERFGCVFTDAEINALFQKVSLMPSTTPTTLARSPQTNSAPPSPPSAQKATRTSNPSSKSTDCPPMTSSTKSKRTSKRKESEKSGAWEHSSGEF